METIKEKKIMTIDFTNRIIWIDNNKEEYNNFEEVGIPDHIKTERDFFEYDLDNHFIENQEEDEEIEFRYIEEKKPKEMRKAIKNWVSSLPNHDNGTTHIKTVGRKYVTTVDLYSGRIRKYELADYYYTIPDMYM